MKLIQKFHQLKTQFLTILPQNEIVLKSIKPLSLLLPIAIGIWLIGPYLAFNDYMPLVQPEKRMYVILAVLLLWLLKFLLIDLDGPHLLQQQDPKTRKKLQLLQQRFQGALLFLKKTPISKKDAHARLNNLPWYLLIGPNQSGKTTLLANSNAPFILQRKNTQEVETSANCDWWVTRDMSIIDVPGSYISSLKKETNEAGPLQVWKFLLHLIKKHRGKRGLAGIIIALPLPEILKQHDPKKHQAILKDLIQAAHTIQTIFKRPLACQLVLTKCDLLPGFNEFFAESSNEEINQTWGITLPASQSNDKALDLFTQRFDALIKKINQQLIWRLHQERNPMTRPYIKDFPLQIERLKQLSLDFVKKFCGNQNTLILQGIYLTSALQIKPEAPTKIIDHETKQRAVQLFKAPAPASRAYFIKQLITQGLPNTQLAMPDATPLWQNRFVYAASAGAIVAVTLVLGRDFEQGVKQTYIVQNKISDYQLTTLKIQNPEEQLASTLTLLNSLHQSLKPTGFRLDLMHLLSFYSNKSAQKASVAYEQALRSILLPEIKNYLAEYLNNPINKNAEMVYAALKAYLMLGDTSHFQADYIANTLGEIAPKNISAADINNLITHAKTALGTSWTPQTLDSNLIHETRKYLSAIPSNRLAYIILKSMNDNNNEIEISLGINHGYNAILVSKQVTTQIPEMFTAKSFPTIINQEITNAAQEALLGNWVLGEDTINNKHPELAGQLIDQIRETYVNNYVDVWESLLANVHLVTPRDLSQTDTIIQDLMSNTSPLLALLQTIHDNTYFEPIVSASPRLQNLGALIEKTPNSDALLNDMYNGLEALHQYVQVVFSATDEKKAAFDLMSNRMLNRGSPDAITKLILVAERTPEPIRSWLQKLANDTWHFLMQDAGRYLDTSWQQEVVQPYEKEIANRYPFSNSDQEVNIQQFIHFFGNPGVIVSYFNSHLQPFIDTSTPDWHWKKIDNMRLPFSEETLRGIQQAMLIHRTFFPNGDDKLYVQFELQPYKFGKEVAKVTLNINDKQFTDDRTSFKNSHVIAWPSNNALKMTSIQQTMADQQIISRDFPGEWGWFKLVNQSYESLISKKEILINLSLNEHPAKYLLLTQGQFNPFLALNFNHFRLSGQLLTQKIS